MTEIVVRPAQKADVDTIAQLRSVGFGSNANAVRRHIADNPRYALKDIVMAEMGNDTCGTACAFPTQMWMSGVPVSMGAVAGVTTHPRARMQGVANAMMRYLLQKMAADGLAISTLFPADHTLYCRYGYGAAAVWHHYSIAPTNLPYFDEVSSVRPFRQDDMSALRSLYRGTQLSQNDGRLSRPKGVWQQFAQIKHPSIEQHLMVYDDDGVTGYVKYLIDAKKNLRIHEMISHTDAAFRGLWAHVATRPEVMAITCSTSADEPLFHLLNVPVDSHHGNRGWIFEDIFHGTSTFMLRIINLAQALTERFYPADLQGNVTLKISDPHLPDNGEPLHFRIVDGRAETHSAAEDAVNVEADIITFSQIYCGFLPPAFARRMGKLTADDAAVTFLQHAMTTRPLYMPQTDWF